MQHSDVASILHVTALKASILYTLPSRTANLNPLGRFQLFCHCHTLITQFLTCRRIGFSGGGIMALCSGCRHVWWRLHSIGATSSV
jgi:hypothetical protein